MENGRKNDTKNTPLQKIGAFWRKTKNGKTYFTGRIELIIGSPINVILYPNVAREGKELGPNAPAYNLLLQKDIQKKEEDKGKAPVD